MNTQQIIKELRQAGPLGPTVNDLMLAAARRLEQQELELVEALRERNLTVANLIDQRDAACDEFRKIARPEPSRLELAGQIYSGSKNVSPRQALLAADEMIAATKY